MNAITFGKIIAHRGASAYAPENTLAAFRKAKELGAEWAECDVQLTRDGEAVIFHDRCLNRTTNGSGWLRWTRYQTVSHLDAGNGEKIPTLATLLACLDNLPLSLHLEIKPCFGRVRKTTETVINILHQHSLQHTKICISSFSYRILRAVHQVDSAILLGMVMNHWNPSWEKRADRLSCVSIHCAKDMLTPDRVREIKNTGRQVLAYTINNREEAEKLYQMGVDSLFSNYPDLLKCELRAEFSQQQVEHGG